MEALAVYNSHGFTADQVELIKTQIAKGCTDDELALFLQQCQRTGLDPFARQIYALRRRQKEGDRYVEKMSIQVSIDGFRVIAERSGEMDGQTVQWCGEDGIWHDVWLQKQPPAAAMVKVYRKLCAVPFPGVAKWSEYAQMYNGKPSGMWDKMPANQLAKCAESLALRRAFPNDLSGLYTREEMSQSEPAPNGTERDYHGGIQPLGVPVEVELGDDSIADTFRQGMIADPLGDGKGPVETTTKGIGKGPVIHQQALSLGWNHDATLRAIADIYGKTSANDLDARQVTEFLKTLKDEGKRDYYIQQDEVTA